jgi:phosphatidylserine/phosphatidylglycerophosphate/cardiolipin synthase-like enzyme
MAKFLNTTGVSYHLEELIKGTKTQLFLVSPYLKFSERVKEHLHNLNIQKKDIRIIYRENKLAPEENNWLGNQIGVRTSICKNLHAKCYISESEAIITSMNLYEFSQVNNNEMGIYITKAGDPVLFESAMQEVSRLLTISEEIRVTVQKVLHTETKETKKPEKKAETTSKEPGYCIRTGAKIPFNLDKPLSAKAYDSWSKYEDEDYPEKFCHFSGEPSNGETSYSKPVLKKYWYKAKELSERELFS